MGHIKQRSPNLNNQRFGSRSWFRDILETETVRKMAKVAALGVVAWLATTSASNPQIFRSATDLVTVTVTVYDKSGATIAGLARDAFSILEDGRPQEIAFFTTEERPISFAIVLDTSGSIVYKIDDVRDAVGHFIDGLKPDDEVFLLRFSTDVEVLSEPGDNRDRLRRAVDRLRPGGGTALFDAVVEGVSELQRGHHDKKALLLVTDGNDTSSRIRPRNASDFVAKSEVLLYALGIGHGERGSFGHDLFGHADRVDIGVLERLADPTGGRSYLLEEAHKKGVDRIDQTVRQIGDELRQQYSLGYYPTNAAKDGTFRRIQVKPSNASYRVRARSGYFAPKASAEPR